MVIGATLSTHLPIIQASIKIWVVIYSLILLSNNIIFTLFPWTFIGILITYCILHHFRLNRVNPNVVNTVFGQDNLAGDNMLGLQTTSRLLQISSSPGGIGTTSGVLGLKNGNASAAAATGSKVPANNTTVETDNYSMQIVAHRGAGLDSPENTLIAFRNASARGCTAVEFDVSITKDGIPVLFHDDDLVRMTGVKKLISEVTMDELKDLELLHPLGKRFPDERIPTLQDGIDTCLELDLRFFIDIKDSKAIPHIVTAYHENPRMYDRAIVTSFNLKIIYDLRNADLNILGCCAWRPGFFRYKGWDGKLQKLEKRNTLFIKDWASVVLDWVHLWFIKNVAWWFIGISAILLNKDGIRRDDLSHWRHKGVRVFSWTVNNPIEKLHSIQNFRIGYLTDTLEMPRVQSDYEFGTPPYISEEKVAVSAPQLTGNKK